MDGSITVLGGTGFIGRHLAGLLVRSGERPFPSPQATDDEFKLRPSPTKRRNSSKPICLMTSLSPVQSRELVRSSTSLAFLPRRPPRPIGPFTRKRSPRSVSALAAQGDAVTRLIRISALGARPISPAISDQTLGSGSLNG